MIRIHLLILIHNCCHSTQLTDLCLIMFVIFLLCLCFQALLCQHASKLKVCPKIRSDVITDVDQLLGDWHLALVIMDEMGEEFEERSMCVQGKIIRTNSTAMLQIWTVDMPELLHQRNSEVDFPTEIITPGIWLVQSPLGGELKGIVIEADGTSYLLMMYCTWHEGLFAHIISVALTRNSVVTPIQRLQLLSLFVNNGYDPYHNKIVSWSNC